MFGLPVALLIRVGIILAIAAAAAWCWHVFAESMREQGREEVRAEWAADTARRVKMTTQITGLWDEQRKKAETATATLDAERAARAEANRVKVAALPPAVAGAVFSGVARRLLNDAIRDSAPPTGTASSPEHASTAPPVDSTVGAITEWGVAVVDLYAACKDQVEGWQQFYSGLRAAQPEPSQ